MKAFLLPLLLTVTFTVAAQETNLTKEELEEKIINYLKETELETKPREWVDKDGITQYTYEPDFLPEYKTKQFYIPETNEEKLYRIVNGRPKASYVRRVTADPRYNDMVENEKRISSLRIKYKKIIKRKKDSLKLIKIKKRDSIRHVNYLINQRRIDSTENASRLEYEKKIEEQREKQRKNQKRGFFKRLIKN